MCSHWLWSKVITSGGGGELAVMCKGISSDIYCTIYRAFLNKELAIAGKLETDTLAQGVKFLLFQQFLLLSSFLDKMSSLSSFYLCIRAFAH